MQIVSLLPDFIGKAKAVSHLPIEVLREMTSLIPRLLSEQPGSILQSLLLVCGVFKTPLQKEVHLPWSPLPQLLEGESDLKTSESTNELAKKWVLSKLSAAVMAFDETSRKLWDSEWPETCRFFLGIQLYYSTFGCLL